MAELRTTGEIVENALDDLCDRRHEVDCTLSGEDGFVLYAYVCELRKENQRLRDCLAWYAFEGKDLTEQTSEAIWDMPYMLAHQLHLYGQRAREALGVK